MSSYDDKAPTTLEEQFADLVKALRHYHLLTSYVAVVATIILFVLVIGG